MAENKRITLILPVYKPSVKWDITIIERYKELQEETNTPLNIVIVNDGSAGETYKHGKAVLQSALPQINFIENEINHGKGYALRCGVTKTEADIYVLTDIDLPYTCGSMKKLIDELSAGADIVIGNRDSSYYQKVSGFRSLLSKSLRFFIRNTLKIPFDDTQCGLKGFNRKGKEIFIKTTINRYLFDMEFIMKAVRNKTIQIKAVPVYLRPGIHLSKMPFKILLHESGNFIKLLINQRK
ncbi:MAG: glycosyltransferase family 2 protein [Sphingobacteriales bacterium]|nr:glycosyltransferase family 2 protein [Sphingobacteriales bacterium]MBI3717367.1 glycosyltransferase family 2 protein [Sphingobacteriales bacterium]